MRDQRAGRCLLGQTCCNTLALIVSSAQDFVLYFFIGSKTDTKKHQFLWADWLQLNSEKNLLKTAQLGGLNPVFLDGFWLNWRELHKSGHTHKAICSLRHWCTYLCSAVIWNIWPACWRNSWVLLIFQTSKYSCWTVKQPWGVDWHFKWTTLKWYLGFRSETENSFFFLFSFCCPKQGYLALESRLVKSAGIDFSFNYFRFSS